MTHTQDATATRKPMSGPLVLASLATLACALWGSAIPVIRFGYKQLEITSDNTGSQLLFAGIRFYDCQLIESGECFFMVFIYARSHSCSFGCTNGTVCVIEFDGGSRRTGQCLAKNGTQKHIGVSGMDLFNGDAHLFHNVDAIFK